jgi:DNA-binding NarL/FixJ family response regulator
MSKIKLMVVDDHQLFREGMISLLSKNPEFECVGEAESAEDMFLQLAEKEVHIVLIDISMPGSSGLEAIAVAREQFPQIKFIVLTMHAEGQYVVKAIRHGAHAYLVKNADEAELNKAIREVALGRQYFNEEISRLMIGNMATEGESHKKLSQRELEVLQKVSEGKTTKEIAEELFVSNRTVESHRVNMMKKLKVHNTAELIKKAVRLNLI